MIRIDINSQKEGIFWLEVKDQAAADEYIKWCFDTQKWGKNEWIEIIPEVPQVVDEGGNVISEAVPEQQIIHPADYSIETSDITAQVEQQKINEESLAYLASTDWMIIRETETGVPCPAEIKQARQAARDRIIR